MFHLVFCLAALLLNPVPVLAENDEHPPGWYVPVGVDVGMSMDGDDLGLLLGAEVSAAYLEGTWWYGLFADALYDSRHDTFRLSMGPEIGWFIFGLDAGVVLEPADDATRWGTRIRGLVGGGLFALYGGWVHIFDIEEGADIGELGLLLKWPFKI